MIFIFIFDYHKIQQVILKPIWFSVLLETKSWLQLSPDKRRRGLYSLNFISDFIRKPLRDEYKYQKTVTELSPSFWLRSVQLCCCSFLSIVCVTLNRYKTETAHLPFILRNFNISLFFAFAGAS